MSTLGKVATAGAIFGLGFVAGGITMHYYDTHHFGFDEVELDDEFDDLFDDEEEVVETANEKANEK